MSPRPAGRPRLRDVLRGRRNAGPVGWGPPKPPAVVASPLTSVSTRLPVRVYGDEACSPYFRRPLDVEAARARVPRFPSGRSVLAAGTVRRAGALPLPCDIVVERDVPLQLRDGTTIYTNVFRPATEGRFPALFGWCPYGKELGGQWLDDVPDRAGVPLSQVSELQAFEGADPAYWVNQGYVVLNPDPRGVGKSEGNIAYWGRQVAEDGYDFIEWIARQDWCTGKVAMTGNSYLAVAQWFIAAEQPPHLAAIAPWEGFSDHFREAGNRGGIPAPQFSEQVLATFSGGGLVEDQPRMMVEEQFRTPYWRDKEARLSRITVPAYVVASWTHPAHTRGTFAGYRQISSADKWLRVHNTQEWRDYYDPARVAELQQFFDHFLKDVDNGWERTPAVRLSILDPGGTDVVDRVEEEFPLARATHVALHLTASGHLSAEPPSTAGTLSYAVGRRRTVTFTTTFTEDTEITGYLSLRLWVQAKGSTDMELSIQVDKLGTDGKPFGTGPMSSLAATGMIRVSQRALDDVRSTPSEPLQTHTAEELLADGEIVPVDVAIWPMGMRYHAGEQLRLSIGDHAGPPRMPDMGFGVGVVTWPADGGTAPVGADVPTVTFGGDRALPEYAVQQCTAPVPTRNAGHHVLHVGGRYDSRLLVPIVPAV